MAMVFKKDNDIELDSDPAGLMRITRIDLNRAAVHSVKKQRGVFAVIFPICCFSAMFLLVEKEKGC